MKKTVVAIMLACGGSASARARQASRIPALHPGSVDDHRREPGGERGQVAGGGFINWRRELARLSAITQTLPFSIDLNVRIRFSRLTCAGFAGSLHFSSPAFCSSTQGRQRAPGEVPCSVLSAAGIGQPNLCRFSGGLWDPYLSAYDVLNTLFLCLWPDGNLRGLSDGNTPMASKHCGRRSDETPRTSAPGQQRAQGCRHGGSTKRTYLKHRRGCQGLNDATIGSQRHPSNRLCRNKCSCAQQYLVGEPISAEKGRGGQVYDTGALCDADPSYAAVPQLNSREEFGEE